jgi:homocitrate synthase NifV
MTTLNRLTLVDTTLRDGEQAAGLSLRRSHKLAILKGLLELGLHDIEAAIPAMGPEESTTYQLMLELGQQFPPSRIIAWNRLKQDDLSHSLNLGCRHIHVSIPSSFAMIQSKLHCTPHALCQKLKDTLDWLAQKLQPTLPSTSTSSPQLLATSPTISLGLEDASRSEPDFLLQLSTIACDYGISRIRYADTTGCLNPRQCRIQLQKLCTHTKASIEFHGHNDYGLAMANSLSAIEAGAHAISATLGGIGERAGNTPLEELLITCQDLYALDCGVQPSQYPALVDLCRQAVNWAGGQIAPHKSIIGSHIFTHESGIHVDGILKCPALYTHLDPARLGTAYKIIPGKHSGISALIWCARTLGYQLNRQEAETLRQTMYHYWETQQPQDPWLAFSTLLAKGAYHHDY